VLWRPVLIAGTLFLSVAAYAQALQAGALQPAAPDGPLPPPLGEHIEAELAYLKTALALTPTQAPLWNRLADVLRMQARGRDALIHFRQSAQENDGKNVQIVVKRSLIDGIDAFQREISADSDDLAKLLAVLKPLYATLTDQQKIIADEIVRPGPGGPHAFGPLGMDMPMIDHGPMMPPPFGPDCKPGDEP
jgi:LTXXQ motif family protein